MKTSLIILGLLILVGCQKDPNAPQPISTPIIINNNYNRHTVDSLNQIILCDSVYHKINNAHQKYLSDSIYLATYIYSQDFYKCCSNPANYCGATCDDLHFKLNQLHQDSLYYINTIKYIKICKCK